MFAKCISTKCDKYSTCLRANIESSSEVNYGYYCFDGDDRWYIGTEVADIHVGESG